MIKLKLFERLLQEQKDIEVVNAIVKVFLRYYKSYLKQMQTKGSSSTINSDMNYVVQKICDSGDIKDLANAISQTGGNGLTITLVGGKNKGGPLDDILKFVYASDGISNEKLRLLSKDGYTISYEALNIVAEKETKGDEKVDKIVGMYLYKALSSAANEISTKLNSVGKADFDCRPYTILKAMASSYEFSHTIKQAIVNRIQSKKYSDYVLDGSKTNFLSKFLKVEIDKLMHNI